MAYRDPGLPGGNPRGGSFGSTLRSEPGLTLADPRHTENTGTLTGGLLIAVLMFLGLLVGVGTLRVGGVGESPATSGRGAAGSASGWSGGTEAAAPPVAPAY